MGTTIAPEGVAERVQLLRMESALTRGETSKRVISRWRGRRPRRALLMIPKNSASTAGQSTSSTTRSLRSKRRRFRISLLSCTLYCKASDRTLIAMPSMKPLTSSITEESQSLTFRPHGVSLSTTSTLLSKRRSSRASIRRQRRSATSTAFTLRVTSSSQLMAKASTTS